MYSNQKVNSKRKNYPLPNYTKQELKEWLFSQKLFHELYNDYENNNFNSKFVPSVDRESPYLPYTFSNIKLMTWEENNKNGNLDRKNGKNNKLSKSVCRCDDKGNVLKEYLSQAEAARKTGITARKISTACNCEGKIVEGFIWKFKK